MIDLLLQELIGALTFLFVWLGIPILLALVGAIQRRRRAELVRLRKRVAELEHDQALFISAA